MCMLFLTRLTEIVTWAFPWWFARIYILPEDFFWHCQECSCALQVMSYFCGIILYWNTFHRCLVWSIVQSKSSEYFGCLCISFLSIPHQLSLVRISWSSLKAQWQRDSDQFKGRYCDWEKQIPYFGNWPQTYSTTINHLCYCPIFTLPDCSPHFLWGILHGGWWAAILCCVGSRAPGVIGETNKAQLWLIREPRWVETGLFCSYPIPPGRDLGVFVNT